MFNATCTACARRNRITQYRFADIFASLKRAQGLRGRIEISGVGAVERVVAGVTFDIEGFDDPVTGLIVSVPDHGERPSMHCSCARVVTYGRMRVTRSSSAAFAAAHGFVPATPACHHQRPALTIVGIALSPEHIYRSAGSIFRFQALRGGVDGPRGLARAYDMDGAFNNVLGWRGRQRARR